MTRTKILYFFITILAAVLLTGSIPVDRIVAVVETYPILKSEIDAGTNFIKKSPFFAEEIKDSLLDNFTDQLIEEKMLEALAVKDSIEIDSSDIEDDVLLRLKDLKEGNFKDEKEYQAFLKASDITEDDILAFYFRQTKNNYIKQQLLMKRGFFLNTTENELVKFYEDNVDSFTVPQSMDLYHMAFVVQPEQGELMSAMQKLEALVQSLKTGVSFSDIAKEYSDDKKTASKGGVVGYQKYSNMPQEIAAFLYSVKEQDTLVFTQSRDGLLIVDVLGYDADSVNYRQILVSVTTTKEDTLTALNKAKAALKKLRSNELSFEDAAKQFSDDFTTAQNGGYIGRIPLESVQGKIKDVLENLEPGKASDIEESDFGYEIFMVKNKEGGGATSYEDVKNIIKMIIENDKVEEAIKGILEKQKKSMYIKVL